MSTSVERVGDASGSADDDDHDDLASVVEVSSAGINLTLATINRVPEVLRSTRRRLGITQRDVADAAGLSQALLVRVERGELNLRVETLLRLLLWLSLAVDQPTPIYVPRRRSSTRG